MYLWGAPLLPYNRPSSLLERECLDNGLLTNSNGLSITSNEAAKNTGPNYARRFSSFGRFNPWFLNELIFLEWG